MDGLWIPLETLSGVNLRTRETHVNAHALKVQQLPMTGDKHGGWNAIGKWGTGTNLQGCKPAPISWCGKQLFHTQFSGAPCSSLLNASAPLKSDDDMGGRWKNANGCSGRTN